MNVRKTLSMHLQRALSPLPVFLMALCILWPGPSRADTFPSRPINVIVPAPAATPIDFVARTLAPVLGANLGQPLIVQNLGGAGGTIGLTKLARSPKDGYTIGIVSVPLAIVPSLYKLPYDTARDIVPVSILTHGNLALVVSSNVPAADVKQLVALAKSHPNPLTYGSPGVGSAGNLLFEMFKGKAGAPFLHVPYKGSDGVSTALMSGEIDGAIIALNQVAPLAKSGRVKVLAVLSDVRAPDLPDVPTLAEQGIKGMDMNTWIAMIAPSGLPADVLERLNTEARRALQDDKVRQTLRDSGSDVIGSGTAEAATTVRNDTTRYGEIIVKQGIKVE